MARSSLSTLRKAYRFSSLVFSIAFKTFPIPFGPSELDGPLVMFTSSVAKFRVFKDPSNVEDVGDSVQITPTHELYLPRLGMSALVSVLLFNLTGWFRRHCLRI